MRKLKVNLQIGEKYGCAIILDNNPEYINNIRYHKTKCSICEDISLRRLSGILRHSKCCNKCKDKTNAIFRVKEDTVFNLIFKRYKHNAYIRGFEFNLSSDEFKLIILSNCFYCNKIPQESLISKHKNKSTIPFSHNGVDRVDNYLGYTLENSVSCCSICNYMKRGMEINDFLDHINNINKFSLEKLVKNN